MEAAGLIEKVEIPKPLNFRFENIRRLPPPILAFDEVAFSYSGKKKDYLYEKLSFGIEYVSCFSCTTQAHGWFHSMDSRIAILGANGAGKSTLLHLITSTLQPVEGTISKHASLKLSKYSQHSSDQLPYNSSPLEYFQRLFFERFPEKDIQVRFLVRILRFITDTLLGMASTTWPFRSFRYSSDIAHPTSLRRSTQPVILVESYDIWRELIRRCLVLSSLNLRWSTLTSSFSVRRFSTGSKARILIILDLQTNPLITWTWHQLMLSLVLSKTLKAAWSSSRTTSASSLR
jgi:hypothetical protein